MSDTPLIVALTADLLLEARLQRAAELAGGRLRAVASVAEAHHVIETDPATAAVVDLADRGVPTEELLASLRAANPALRLLGFFPHVMPDLGREAERAGYHIVVPRSRFLSDAAGLMRALLADGSEARDGTLPRG